MGSEEIPLTNININFLTSFLYNLYCSKVDSIANFYLPFSRLWELVVGAILAELKLIKSKYLNLYSILGLLLIVVCLFTINDGASYPGWLAKPAFVGPKLSSVA